MYKIEIKHLAKLSQMVESKETQLIFFETQEQANTYFQDVLSDNQVLKDKGEHNKQYVELKTNKLMQIKLSPCKNTDIPKLNEKEVYTPLYTSNKNVLKTAIIKEFREEILKDDYLEKHYQISTKESLIGLKRNIKIFIDKNQEIIVATQLKL